MTFSLRPLHVLHCKTFCNDLQQIVYRILYQMTSKQWGNFGDRMRWNLNLELRQARMAARRILEHCETPKCTSRSNLRHSRGRLRRRQQLAGYWPHRRFATCDFRRLLFAEFVLLFSLLCPNHPVKRTSLLRNEPNAA